MIKEKRIRRDNSFKSRDNKRLRETNRYMMRREERPLRERRNENLIIY
jgi:hypothetical protein